MRHLSELPFDPGEKRVRRTAPVPWGSNGDCKKSGGRQCYQKVGGKKQMGSRNSTPNGRKKPETPEGWGVGKWDHTTVPREFGPRRRVPERKLISTQRLWNNEGGFQSLKIKLTNTSLGQSKEFKMIEKGSVLRVKVTGN